MDKNKYEERVDNLIQHFWKYGYMTLSRKFGTYLPEPSSVGKYDVDAIGKQKKKYAIGIILKEEELDDPKIYSKLEFLSTRETKYSHRRVTLFVGVSREFLYKAKNIVSNLSEEARKNIKVVTIPNYRFN